jgi:hypothetical protein
MGSVMKEFTTEGLHLYADIDGTFWFSFGQYAHVSVEAIKLNRGPLVCHQIDQWISKQKAKTKETTLAKTLDLSLSDTSMGRT